MVLVFRLSASYQVLSPTPCFLAIGSSPFFFHFFVWRPIFETYKLFTYTDSLSLMSGLPDNRRVVDHHHYSRMTKVGASNTYLASDMGRGAREIPTRSSPMARALAHSRGQHNDHDDGDSDDGDEGDDNSDPNGDDNDTPPNASGLGFSATAASKSCCISLLAM